MGESQMRKFLISAALAASTLVAAAPAAAQYYPPQPQGYAYGYNNYGQARRLQARIDQLQHQIIQLDRRNILSEREAARLRGDSRQLEQRLRYAARNGLNGRERYDIERGIQRLEYRVQREARDGNRYGYRQVGYGYGDGWSDRDRDGRNDRYENDHGRDHDD
jgi:hypothetical protein